MQAFQIPASMQEDDLKKNKTVGQQLRQINILREQMIHDASNFTTQLDDLQRKLIKKSNQFDLLNSKQMHQISLTNISMLQEFISYQKNVISNLQSDCNWAVIQHELNDVQAKIQNLLKKDGLVCKLAKIQCLEHKIQKLCHQITNFDQAGNKNNQTSLGNQRNQRNYINQGNQRDRITQGYRGNQITQENQRNKISQGGSRNQLSEERFRNQSTYNRYEQQYEVNSNEVNVFGVKKKN